METLTYHILIVVICAAFPLSESTSLTSLRRTSSQTDQYVLECDSDVGTPGGRIITWFRDGNKIFQTKEDPLSSCDVKPFNVTNIIDRKISFNCTSTKHIVTFRLRPGADDDAEWWCEDTAGGQERISNHLKLESTSLTRLPRTISQTDQYVLECDSDVRTPGGRIITWFRDGNKIFQTTEGPLSSCNVKPFNVTNIIDGKISFNCTSTKHIVTFRLRPGGDDDAEWWCEDTAGGQERISNHLKLGSTIIASSTGNRSSTGRTSTGTDHTAGPTRSVVIASSTEKKSSTGRTSTGTDHTAGPTRRTVIALSTEKKSSTGRTSTGTGHTAGPTRSVVIASSTEKKSSTGRTSTGTDHTAGPTRSAVIALSTLMRSSAGRTSTGIDDTGSSTRSTNIASSTGKKPLTGRTSTGTDNITTSTGTTTAPSTENNEDSSKLVYIIAGSVCGTIVAVVAVIVTVYTCRIEKVNGRDHVAVMQDNDLTMTSVLTSVENTDVNDE